MIDQLFVRNVEYSMLFERFLLAAVGTILAVRSFLRITDYPAVGGHGLHIAHMLWGGTFMAIALMLYMFFISTRLSRFTPILGGIGFGLFIDEVGKFVTADNNYFFQPSFAIMYVFFVLLYLFAEGVGLKRFSKKEYLSNSLQLLQEVINENFDSNEKKKATHYLKKAGDDELVAIIKKAFAQAETLPAKPNIFSESYNVIEQWYVALVSKKWFTRALVIFFLLDAIISLFLVMAVSFGVGTSYLELIIPKSLIHIHHNTALNVLELESVIISGVFTLLGVVHIRRRLTAYRYFRWSILISLFVTQVFAFYQFQLGALIGFVFNVLVLITLNFLIAKQRAGED